MNLTEVSVIACPGTKCGIAKLEDGHLCILAVAPGTKAPEIIESKVSGWNTIESGCHEYFINLDTNDQTQVLIDALQQIADGAFLNPMANEELARNALQEFKIRSQR